MYTSFTFGAANSPVVFQKTQLALRQVLKKHDVQRCCPFYDDSLLVNRSRVGMQINQATFEHIAQVSGWPLCTEKSEGPVQALVY